MVCLLIRGTRGTAAAEARAADACMGMASGARRLAKIAGNRASRTDGISPRLRKLPKNEAIGMKMTPRRKRSDSAAAAVAATQAAALGPLAPPKHIKLRRGDRPFWNGIVSARPRDTWTESDLVMAASLARCQADIEALQRQIDADGFLIDGKPHPCAEMLEKATRRAMALGRAIAVNTVATVGRSADIAKGAALEREAREADDDDLIPRLHAIK